jgi:hypothetical protein
VLKGDIHYSQVSGVGRAHILSNLSPHLWPPVFLLTAGAFLPFLALNWGRTQLSLKRQVAFLLPVLFVSSLVFSNLYETRNFMPLVFVLAVVAGQYLFGCNDKQQNPQGQSFTSHGRNLV